MPVASAPERGSVVGLDMPPRRHYSPNYWQGKTDFGATYAAIVVSLVPTLILYFILNRQVINGMAAGAVRGW